MNTSPSQADVDDVRQLEHSMSAVAYAIADPSRVSMLCALMDGRAWTATELSTVANISASTASAHLAKLLNNRLVTCLAQGRHRYYRLAGRHIAGLLETLMGVSMSEYPRGIRTPQHLRHARTCYDHLAGEVAVQIYDYMSEAGWFLPDCSALSSVGVTGFAQMGAQIDSRKTRKNACACLDWSERRFHLGGSAGAALFIRFEQQQWITRTPGYREVIITRRGKAAFSQLFKLHL